MSLGGLYLEGRFNGGIFALRFWGAYIWKGLFSEFYGIRGGDSLHFLTDFFLPTFGQIFRAM